MNTQKKENKIRSELSKKYNVRIFRNVGSSGIKKCVLLTARDPVVIQAGEFCLPIVGS